MVEEEGADKTASLFEAEMGRLYTGGALGVAVSGGGDSIALLHLTRHWAAKRGIALKVATVDHALRPESAAEAASVAACCEDLGLPHDTLTWTDWSGRGNLQAAARDARRRLLSDWAKSKRLSAVLLGHTMDDQAETVLMRLGRGSGVDGLSGMRPYRELGEMAWLRPLLWARRADLRAWLRDRRIGWVDDPSNDNPQFDRIKARRAVGRLADLGVTAEGLAATAARLQDARDALDHAAGVLAADATRWGSCGEFYLTLSPYRAAPTELQRRLLRAALTRVAGADYGPRAHAEQKLLSAILSLRLSGGRSLHGCLIRPNGVDGVVITREVAAAKAGCGVLWDGRFELEAMAEARDARILALGEAGVRRLARLEGEGLWRAPPDWSAAPRAAQLSTPALFAGETLIAAPIAQYGDALKARFAAPEAWWSGLPSATV